jgi:hypothetical protein
VSDRFTADEAAQVALREASRDYLQRTIATVRNHSPEENSWVAWANLFADEIERLWRLEEQLETYEFALRELADDGRRQRIGQGGGIALYVREVLNSNPARESKP